MAQHTGNQTIQLIESGKIPPQNLDAEARIIGAILLEPESLHDIEHYLKVEYFYNEANGIIYKACLDLYNALKPIDLVTIGNKLREDKTLDRVGGLIYLSSVTQGISSAVNVDEYARIVEHLFAKRSVIAQCYKVLSLSYDDGANVEEAEAEINSTIQMLENIITPDVIKADIATLAMNEVEGVKIRIASREKNEIVGVPTGVKEFDEHWNGWQKSDLIVIAARPGMGKTALALNHAKCSKVPTVYFSLEMSKEQLTGRLLLSYLTRLSSDRYRNGNMTDADMRDIEKAGDKVAVLPLTIIDDKFTWSHIRSSARTLHRHGKAELIIIDYLQLILHTATISKANREQVVAELTRNIKLLAKELNVPVILLCQLNRAVESRGDKTPMLADLRESGAIEQDADIVLSPFRPFYYSKDNAEAGKMFVYTLKHRSGRLYDAECEHNESITAIYPVGSFGVGSIDRGISDELTTKTSYTATQMNLNDNFTNEKPAF